MPRRSQLLATATMLTVAAFAAAPALAADPSPGPTAETTTLPPAASASSSPDATAAPDASSVPDLLPGVELVVEEVEPGVYRVLNDGVRDVRGRGMAVSADGDVWLLRGGSGDWSVVRLGEPGVSLHLTDVKNRRVSLRLDPSGAPLVISHRVPSGESRAHVFDGTAWVRTDPPAEPACPGELEVPMPDGVCWGGGPSRLAGDRWHLVQNAEFGVADDQMIEEMTVGPDGTGWFSVRSGDRQTFDGLLRYDGDTWTPIPYAPSGGPVGGEGSTRELAVAPDGTVWLTELSRPDLESVTVRSWDGATWTSYGPGDAPDLRSWCSQWGCAVPGGIHFNSDGTIWFMGGTVYFDGQSLLPVDRELLRTLLGSFTPDGNIWILDDRRPLVITPEAVAGNE